MQERNVMTGAENCTDKCFLNHVKTSHIYSQAGVYGDGLLLQNQISLTGKYGDILFGDIYQFNEGARDIVVGVYWEYVTPKSNYSEGKFPPKENWHCIVGDRKICAEL